MTSLPLRHRLYIQADLAAGARLVLDAGHAHYLRDVVRVTTGAVVAVFNGRQGEWSGELVALAKNRAELELRQQLRPQVVEPDLWLCFAPIKGHRLDTIIEKATELGCRALQPVLTRRTVVSRVNLDRMRANAIEAAEQSERLGVPQVREPVRLDRLLETWDSARLLLHCDERSLAPPMLEVLKGQPRLRPAAVLTGPEGGFDAAEQAAIGRLAAVCPVTLGPRILRADTAAIAALTLWQAVLGDWGEGGRS